jgi:predicted metal-dependent phosphotriesterase family hydrolase
MEMSSFLLLDAPRPIQTVLGEIPYRVLGITDAHNHVWIDPTPGADPTAPSLNQFEKIREELILYRAAGGKTLLDCQPGGCGRDANKLA